MEEMRDGMMNRLKNSWKVVRGTLVPAAGPGYPTFVSVARLVQEEEEETENSRRYTPMAAGEPNCSLSPQAAGESTSSLVYLPEKKVAGRSFLCNVCGEATATRPAARDEAGQSRCNVKKSGWCS